jgi:hypothetical protein
MTFQPLRQTVLSRSFAVLKVGETFVDEALVDEK